MVQVHAFLICNVFSCDMNIGKVFLKELILSTKFLSKHLHDKNGNEISFIYWEKFKWRHKNW